MNAPIYKFSLPPAPPLNSLHFSTRGGQRVLTDHARNYKKTCGLIMLEAGVRPIIGLVRVTLHIFRKPDVPQRKADVDSAGKLILDLMQGIAYANDRQVKALYSEWFDEYAGDPRVEVIVEEWKP